VKARIIKFVLLPIPVLAVIAAAIYVFAWRSPQDDGQEQGAPKDEHVYGISAKLPPAMSLKELQGKILKLQQQPTHGVRWFMNIPKDELAVIGPPMGTTWATPEQLWAKGMAGLYFVGTRDKESPIEKKKKEEEKNKLLQELLKD
jgi:hypothetical protein